jgi:uncharacterized protein
MHRQQAIDILVSNSKRIKTFGVRSISVFGSVARDDAADHSDIDLLVEFDKPIGLFAFCHLRRFLVEILGCSVDLVTPDALKQQLKDRILREAVRVA